MPESVSLDEQLAALVNKVADEWEVGGMGPDSMYGEFAIEVAKRALTQSETALGHQSEKRDAYPDTEADGVVFCGKCGARR